MQCITQGISDLSSDKLVHFKVYPTLSLDRIGAIKGISDLVFGQNWCSVLLKLYPTWCILRYIQPCLRTNWCSVLLKVCDLLSDKMVHFEVYLTLSSDKIGASENIYPTLSTEELPFLMTSEGPAKSDTV